MLRTQNQAERPLIHSSLYNKGDLGANFYSQLIFFNTLHSCSYPVLQAPKRVYMAKLVLIPHSGTGSFSGRAFLGQIPSTIWRLVLRLWAGCLCGELIKRSFPFKRHGGLLEFEVRVEARHPSNQNCSLRWEPGHVSVLQIKILAEFVHKETHVLKKVTARIQEVSQTHHKLFW